MTQNHADTMLYIEPTELLGWGYDDLMGYMEQVEGEEFVPFTISGPADYSRFMDELGAASVESPSMMRKLASLRVHPSFAKSMDPTQLNVLHGLRNSAMKLNAGLAGIEAKEAFRPNLKQGFNCAPLAPGGSVTVTIQPGKKIAGPWRFCGLTFPDIYIGIIGIKNFTIDAMPVDTSDVTQVPAATIGGGIVGSLAEFDTRSPGDNMLLPYLGLEFTKDSVWQFELWNITTAGDINVGTISPGGSFLLQGEPCQKLPQGIAQQQTRRAAARLYRRRAA